MSNEVIDDVYYPPKGVYFRLHNPYWQYCFYARDHLAPHTGCVWQSSTAYTDQFFQLVRDEKNPTNWRLQNKRTDKYLTAGTYNNDWISHDAGLVDASRLILKPPAADGYKGQFRVIFRNKDFEGAMVVNNDGPYLVPTSWQEDRNQYWQMEFEDMKFDRLEWDLDKKEFAKVLPAVLFSQDSTNKTSEKQTVTVSSDHTLSHTSEFTKKLGVSAKWTNEVSVDIPGIGKVGSKFEYGFNTEFGWGQKTTSTTSCKFSQPITVPPWTRIRARAKVQKGDVEIPFTVIFKSGSTGTSCKTYGVWKGVTAWDFEVTAEEMEKFTPT